MKICSGTKRSCSEFAVIHIEYTLLLHFFLSVTHCVGSFHVLVDGASAIRQHITFLSVVVRGSALMDLCSCVVCVEDPCGECVQVMTACVLPQLELDQMILYLLSPLRVSTFRLSHRVSTFRLSHSPSTVRSVKLLVNLLCHPSRTPPIRTSRSKHRNTRDMYNLIHNRRCNDFAFQMCLISPNPGRNL